MSKLLKIQSTLTDRYQTTIPEVIRESLHLSKRDKITFTLEKNGKVLLSRAKEANEEDPVLGQFLVFLTHDLKHHPSHVRSISPTLMKRARRLTSGVKIDWETPLDDKDE